VLKIYITDGSARKSTVVVRSILEMGQKGLTMTCEDENFDIDLTNTKSFLREGPREASEYAC
jgi:hypothetical protein